MSVSRISALLSPVTSLWRVGGSPIIGSTRRGLQHLVSNVTPDAVEKDPELAAYMEANFPHAMNPDYEAPVPSHKAKLHSPGLARSLADGEEAEIAEDRYPRNIRPLTTYLRDAETESNSRRSRYLRAIKWIPGLLYGGDPTRGIFSHQPDSKTSVKTPWYLLERELDRFPLSFEEARVYELTVMEEENDDTPVMDPQLVVPANVQRHPVQHKLYCANYLRYHPGRPLKLPVTHVNQEESPTLKRDGFLVPIARRIECWVDEGVDIPDSIELECSGLQFRDVVRRDRLILPDGVHLTDRVLKRGDDFVVAVVDGKGRGGDE